MGKKGDKLTNTVLEQDRDLREWAAKSIAASKKA